MREREIGRGRGPGPWAWAAALAGVLAAPGPAPAAAPRAIEVENLRVGFTSNNRSNLFKLGTWTPVWVQLRAGAERFSGVMEVIVPDDDGTPTAFRQVVDVAPYSSERYTTYARPGTADPDFTIRLLDQRGRRKAPDVSGASVAKLDPIRPDEVLLVTLGRPQGVEMIPGLPGFTPDPNNPNNARGTELTVARIDTLADALPGRWYGFDAAQTIVLDTNDRDTMARLNASGGQAIREWVRRGGHLVVAVGSDWSRVVDSFLLLKDDPMLPGRPTGQERVTDLGSLETFAGASKPITPVGAPTAVLVTKFEEVEAHGGKILSAAGPIPLVIRGPFGFGRVTVVALDVDQKPFADWADRPLFWIKAIDFRRQGGGDPNAPGTMIGGGRGRFYQSGVSDLSSLLRRALEQFSDVKLVPFGWVAFFIFVYILLIGPGDYLFLKRVVKRMELTWITFPIIVVSVSLLAYYAAYVVKGKELRVNKVDIVDVDQATGQARGSVWMNLFSPQNRDYGVAVLPLPLDRDTPKPAARGATGGSAMTERPAPGTEVVTSWFGVPEPRFGGMGNSGRLSLSSGGYAYDPIGGAERLDAVRVPIWSTKCLTARWFGPASPMVEADLQPVGTDRLSGTITNTQGVPLKDAILAFGNQVYELQTIAPGQTVRVELSTNRSLSGFLRSKTASYVSNQPYMSEEFQINRADLMLALMFHDSATGAAGSGEAALTSVPLHDLDLTGQLALDRPMLVARYDRPPTRLALDNAPSAPMIAQTTLVRVILPLGKSQADDEKK